MMQGVARGPLSTTESSREEVTTMTPPTSQDEQPQRSQQQPTPGSGSVSSSGPSVNQRLGLAVISLVFLVFLANIMAALSSSFGSTGSTIGFAAGCLAVLGINVVFNLEAVRSRQ
jgi:hypothetical protein